MTVNAQYAREHFDELLLATDNGEEVEVSRDGKPSIRLFVMPAPHLASVDPIILGTGQGDSPSGVGDEWQQRMKKDAEPMPRRPIFGAGRGEIVLPTDEEWKAMDKELEDLLLNGALFPATAE